LKEYRAEQKEEGELLVVDVLPLNHLHIGGSSVIGWCACVVGAMLRLEELAFIKALSTLESSLGARESYGSWQQEDPCGHQGGVTVNGACFYVDIF